MLAADNEEAFLLNLGRLMHLQANLLPCKLGTAGILDWLARGAAAAKGIELGRWNWDGPSWDFKALVTPDREVYARWFAEHAFVTKTT